MDDPTRQDMASAIQGWTKAKRPKSKGKDEPQQTERRAEAFFTQVTEPVLRQVQEEAARHDLSLEIQDGLQGNSPPFRKSLALLFPREHPGQPESERPGIVVGWQEGESVAVWVRKEDGRFPTPDGGKEVKAAREELEEVIARLLVGLLEATGQ
jgi:hypothetical protein